MSHVHMTVRKFNLIDTSKNHEVQKGNDQDNILIFNFNYIMQNMLAKVDTSAEDKTPR
jgi:hypothetical protein